MSQALRSHGGILPSKGDEHLTLEDYQRGKSQCLRLMGIFGKHPTLIAWLHALKAGEQRLLSHDSLDLEIEAELRKFAA